MAWLYTFEPNRAWAELAIENLDAIGGNYLATVGTFEDNFDRITDPIDLAFIDAVHTSDWVQPQFDLVVSRCKTGAIVLLDDIDFSEDMRSCWRRLSTDSRVKGAAR